jgi:hypothetical protein
MRRGIPHGMLVPRFKASQPALFLFISHSGLFFG